MTPGPLASGKGCAPVPVGGVRCVCEARRRRAWTSGVSHTPPLLQNCLKLTPVALSPQLRKQKEGMRSRQMENATEKKRRGTRIRWPGRAVAVVKPRGGREGSSRERVSKMADGL
ncbi:hypothetical protein TRVL_02343 [Trypanosoma vivax]|nr:hypothetical protein TRVL_02343 [Trypanosoma vivax]